VEPGCDGERRDAMEGLNRQISCIHWMYNSRCGRRAAGGSRPCSAHQEVAARVRFGVVTREAFEASHVGSHCQLQPVSKRLGRVRGRVDQLSECRHAMTLRRLAVTMKVTDVHLAADEDAATAPRSLAQMAN
jgi:hypothetical protein